MDCGTKILRRGLQDRFDSLQEWCVLFVWWQFRFSSLIFSNKRYFWLGYKFLNRKNRNQKGRGEMSSGKPKIGRYYDGFWKEMPGRLNRGRSGFRAFVSNGKIFIIGGSSGTLLDFLPIESCEILADDVICTDTMAELPRNGSALDISVDDKYSSG